VYGYCHPSVDEIKFYKQFSHEYALFYKNARGCEAEISVVKELICFLHLFCYKLLVRV